VKKIIFDEYFLTALLVALLVFVLFPVSRGLRECGDGEILLRQTKVFQ
jgi:hypothetical protein